MTPYRIPSGRIALIACAFWFGLTGVAGWAADLDEHDHDHDHDAPAPLIKGTQAGLVDVGGWFLGCAALTQPAAADIMDVNCLILAVQEYCVLGYDEDATAACQAELAVTIDGLSLSIAQSLPHLEDVPELLRPTYAARLHAMDGVIKEADASCDPDMSAAFCAAFSAGNRWLAWREVSRIAADFTRPDLSGSRLSRPDSSEGHD